VPHDRLTLGGVTPRIIVQEDDDEEEEELPRIPEY
jgi:hypothetical protein